MEKSNTFMIMFFFPEVLGIESKVGLELDLPAWDSQVAEIIGCATRPAYDLLICMSLQAHISILAHSIYIYLQTCL